MPLGHDLLLLAAVHSAGKCSVMNTTRTVVGMHKEVRDREVSGSFWSVHPVLHQPCSLASPIQAWSNVLAELQLPGDHDPEGGQTRRQQVIHGALPGDRALLQPPAEAAPCLRPAAALQHHLCRALPCWPPRVVQSPCPFLPSYQSAQPAGHLQDVKGGLALGWPVGERRGPRDGPGPSLF